MPSRYYWRGSRAIREFPGEFGGGVGRGVSSVKVQPADAELIAKPGHLPFGELPGTDFDQLDGFGE